MPLSKCEVINNFYQVVFDFFPLKWPLSMVFKTEVSGLGLNTEVIDMSRGIFVLSLTPQAAIEVSHLLGISRVSSKKSKRTSLVLEWSQWCCS